MPKAAESMWKAQTCGPNLVTWKDTSESAVALDSHWLDNAAAAAKGCLPGSVMTMPAIVRLCRPSAAVAVAATTAEGNSIYDVVPRLVPLQVAYRSRNVIVQRYKAYALYVFL